MIRACVCFRPSQYRCIFHPDVISEETSKDLKKKKSKTEENIASGKCSKVNECKSTKQGAINKGKYKSTPIRWRDNVTLCRVLIWTRQLDSDFGRGNITRSASAQDNDAVPSSAEGDD
ncbi:hypothetical protein ACE6H2_006034 [Prunus campanulata]